MLIVLVHGDISAFCSGKVETGQNITCVQYNFSLLQRKGRNRTEHNMCMYSTISAYCSGNVKTGQNITFVQYNFSLLQRKGRNGTEHKVCTIQFQLTAAEMSKQDRT